MDGVQTMWNKAIQGLISKQTMTRGKTAKRVTHSNLRINKPKKKITKFRGSQ